MLEAQFWWPFPFLLFLVVACHVRSWEPIHLQRKQLDTVCLLQFSMWAGLLLKFHICNDLPSVKFPVMIFYYVFMESASYCLSINGVYWSRLLHQNSFLVVLQSPKRTFDGDKPKSDVVLWDSFLLMKSSVFNGL